MVGVNWRWIVLIDQEQRTWYESERFSAAEAGGRLRGVRQPARPWTRHAGGGEGVSAVAVGGVGIAVMFLLVGEPVVASVIGGASALGWLLWRYWRQLGVACATTCLPMLGEVGGAGGTEPEQDPSSGRPRRMSEAD
jgi:hypothetical protein